VPGGTWVVLVAGKLRGELGRNRNLAGRSEICRLDRGQ
jgi:hypothetical protein